MIRPQKNGHDVALSLRHVSSNELMARPGSESSGVGLSVVLFSKRKHQAELCLPCGYDGTEALPRKFAPRALKPHRLIKCPRRYLWWHHFTIHWSYVMGIVFLLGMEKLMGFFR